MTYLESATKAIEKARDMQAEGKIDDCHVVAHMIGKANLFKYNYNLGKALATCPTDCIQGCIHGAVQTYVSEKVDISNLKEELTGICEGLDPQSIHYLQCLHGLGHGFLTGGYMSINEAIQTCETMDSIKRMQCLGGVFMENMQSNLLLPESEFAARLPTTCASVESLNRSDLNDLCYDAMGEGIMFYTAHNLARSLEYCTMVSDVHDHITSCKNGARVEARTILKQTSSQQH